MLGKLLCRLGLHRWDKATIKDGPEIARTYNWCERLDCKYRRAMLVDEKVIRGLKVYDG